MWLYEARMNKDGVPRTTVRDEVLCPEKKRLGPASEKLIWSFRWTWRHRLSFLSTYTISSLVIIYILTELADSVTNINKIYTVKKYYFFFKNN